MNPQPRRSANQRLTIEILGPRLRDVATVHFIDQVLVAVLEHVAKYPVPSARREFPIFTKLGLKVLVTLYPRLGVHND